MKKIRWGVLSTAKIARTKVIPALQASALGEVVAIGSRSEAQARDTAHPLHIPRAYGSYEALLADPDIDAIYNPLPNHLHVPWSIKALEAGKHVLCEKPLGLNLADVDQLLAAAARHPELKVMEAFMYRFHPQWQALKKLVDGEQLGQLRTLLSLFAYNNRDEANIRNRPEVGGGALMDIGCYGVSAARWLFAGEPLRVLGHMSAMPGYEVDCLTSAILEFADGTATFTASTKTEPAQWLEICGENGSARLELPFNPVPGQDCLTHIKAGGQTQVHNFRDGDQYQEMADAFARSIIAGRPVPTPLADARANMRVMDALVASAEQSTWITLD